MPSRHSSYDNPAPRRVLILGAAGRDFHNFNVVFRDDPANPWCGLGMISRNWRRLACGITPGGHWDPC
jgi:hypothetical protein